MSDSLVDYVVLCGDTNFEDNESSEALRDFEDAWLSVGLQHDAGITFAPKRNETTALTSVRGLARRYDRVFVRGIGCQTASLCATASLSPTAYTNVARSSPLCPSDHYALCVRLANTSGYADVALRSLGDARLPKIAAKTVASILRAIYTDDQLFIT